jgi:hypothetical protein
MVLNGGLASATKQPAAMSKGQPANFKSKSNK